MQLVWSGVYFAAMVAEIVIRLPYDRARRRLAKTDQRVDLRERLLLGLLTVGIFFVPAVHALTPWLDFANYNLPADLALAAGVVGTLLMGVALLVFWRAHVDLGTNWSPSLEINAKQSLVTRGIYGLIRHPMYASQVVWSLAQGLLLQNWVAGWIGLLLFIPLYLIRVPREEQMMRDHFGAEYDAYAARTGRVFPR